MNFRGLLVKTTAGTRLSQLKSNTTCYICFYRRPTAPLRCGHSFCGVCFRRLNQDGSEKHVVILRNCPLHREEDDQPLTVEFKPSNAGVRVLTLDGYVQLCIMQSIPC